MQDKNSSVPHASAFFPPEVGKLAIVTSSASGLGLEMALALAHAGADVIVTGPRAAEGHEALARIRPHAPHSLVRFERLDLESLASVADFAARLEAAGRPIDLLVNNASSLSLLRRQVTREGFEIHFVANYLSHFALTARLMPLLRSGRQPRVVHVTETGRHHGEIHFDDLQIEHEYTPLKAYSQSKLAVLLFALELQRQSDRYGWGIVASAAQPIGPRAAALANTTEVVGSHAWYRRALGLTPGPRSSGGRVQALLNHQEREAPPASNGHKTLTEILGPPAPEALDLRSLDPGRARRLWDLSTQLTGVPWPQA